MRTDEDFFVKIYLVCPYLLRDYFRRDACLPAGTAVRLYITHFLNIKNEIKIELVSGCPGYGR